MEMKDWRGNEYPEEKLIMPNGCPILCENCKRQAVRNCCVAEGDIGRTHWHGAIHTKDGGIKHLCRKCADKENEKWGR